MRQGGSREEVADRSAKGDISECLFCASHCVPCDAGYTGDKGRGGGGVHWCLEDAQGLVGRGREWRDPRFPACVWSVPSAVSTL